MFFGKFKSKRKKEKEIEKMIKGPDWQSIIDKKAEEIRKYDINLLTEKNHGGLSDLMTLCCLKIKYECIIIPIVGDALTHYVSGEGEVIIGTINEHKVELRRIGGPGCIATGRSYLNENADLGNIDKNFPITSNNDCVGFIDGFRIKDSRTLELMKECRLLAIIQTKNYSQCAENALSA